MPPSPRVASRAVRSSLRARGVGVAMGVAFPNRNILWAEIVVDEAVRQGVKAAVVVPGSRSTPLVWAWSRQGRVPVFTPWDERSAGYFALGLATALEGPVAVVTTSGTAVANLYPAVLEAERIGLPLLLMTADRPPEAYESGANQTVDQIKMFGNRVRWFAQAPLPEARPPERLLRSLRTLMVRAVAHAMGMTGAPGPVHLNFPFRKPLEPLEVPGDVPEAWQHHPPRPVQGREAGRPWTRLTPARPLPPQEALQEVAALLCQSPRGVVVAGPYLPGGGFPQALTRLARRLGYPLLADPLSGLRFGPWVREGPVLGGYALALEAGWQPEEPPQVVLRFGAMPVGRGLLQALETWAEALHILVDPFARWRAADHHPAWLFQADGEAWVQGVLAALPAECDRSHSPWLRAWQEVENRVARMLPAAPATEGMVLEAVVQALPEAATLVVGNSLPVRHLEEIVLPRPKRVRVWANRGTSGIDGVLSTAMGLLAGGRRPLVAVLGDHSFLYDLNILALVRERGWTPVIVVLHNDGGGIFYRLPIRDFDPPFTAHFRHPHGLDFAGVARTFGLRYQQVAVGEVEHAVADALARREAALLVVPTDAQAHEAWRRGVLARLSSS